MQEGCSSEDHGELTRVVAVVEPAGMSHVPSMESTWEPHNPITSFSPHSVCVCVCVCVCGVCVYVCVCACE